METETFPLARRQRAPIFERGIEQSHRADDIGFDERCRGIDRAIDVRLCRQVHDALQLLVTQQAEYGHGVGDISLDESEIGRRLHVAERCAVAGICQLVQADDMIAARDQQATYCRADEPGPAGDEHTPDHAASCTHRRR